MRGINVGGKNKIPMAALKTCLEAHGFEKVRTYIQSGNVIVRSPLSAKALSAKIERILPAEFKLDRSIIKVLALEHKTFKTVVAEAPKGFGADNVNYRYYVLFLMGIRPDDAMKDIAVRPDVDRAWVGSAAIYYRLPSLASSNATKSYLNKITQKPLYQQVTMRNWNTTTKLLAMLEKE